MVTINQNLVPASKYSIKCPYTMNPIGITVHNTANNASARNEIAYMVRNNNEVSYHFAVDDVEALQGLPLDRNGWHASDGGSGTGNRKTIAIEICYSTGDKTKFEKSQDNAAQLCAYLLKKYNWTTNDIYTHQHWYPKKHCPHRTLDEYGWDYFINLVKKYLGQTQETAPTPAPSAKELYRIRKSWKDAASQIGAYNNLDNAKKACKDGYYVFDSKGNVVYPTAAPAPTPTKKTVQEIAAEVWAGKWGNGAVRKQRLEAAGYDYNEVQKAVAAYKTSTTPAKKSNEEIAKEVLAGKWGNGTDRKNRLTAAGYDYNAIQSIVNGTKATPTTPAKKSVEEIAAEVWAGKWGNGADRKKRLEAAGYNYAEVQAAVAKKSSSGYKVQVTASALNVRAGAGTSYRIVKVIHKGETYTIIQTSGNWGKLSDGSGWISLSYAKKV